MLCKDYRDAHLSHQALCGYPELRVHGHNIISLYGLAGRKLLTEAVHNYTIVLVAVSSDPNTTVLWNGKDAGKDCATISFQINAMPASERIPLVKGIQIHTRFQASKDVSCFYFYIVQSSTRARVDINSHFN